VILNCKFDALDGLQQHDEYIAPVLEKFRGMIEAGEQGHTEPSSSVARSRDHLRQHHATIFGKEAIDEVVQEQDVTLPALLRQSLGLNAPLYKVLDEVLLLKIIEKVHSITAIMSRARPEERELFQSLRTSCAGSHELHSDYNVARLDRPGFLIDVAEAIARARDCIRWRY
jgi:hypothetical protein